ncbi:S4 domain-containing protein YaaA [Desemzia sp. FAM 23991]|uniref:S4 domain-containing protein YaaA n=1 Tax=unclassified Desemzia TaxID=2685243 RepID=UPI0038843439
MKETVLIDSEYITLGQLLKHVDIISSGGMAKHFLAENSVFLDNELENRRGKKIFPGSIVEIPGEGTYFIQHESSEELSEESR